MSRCELSLQKRNAFKVPGQKCNAFKDRISELPDEILVLIMHLMSVDESEKFKELSRQWKDVWKSMIKVMPRLDFNGKEKLISLLAITDDKAKYDDHKAITVRAREAYVNWVNQILKLHESQTLDEFSICFPLVSNHSLDINTWLEFASGKGVRKLRLDFSPFSRFGINFGCHGRRNYDGVSLASSLKLYCLRDVYFDFLNLDENFVNSLLSNSPFLERLSVNNSKKLRKFELVGANKLKFLEIKGCIRLQNIQICSAPYLRDLDLEKFMNANFDQRVDICAPNLRSFKFAGHSGVPIWFEDGVALHNLSYVNLYYSSYIKFDYFQHLLGHFSTVKTLILGMSVLQVGPMDLWHRFPELSNVEHLEMSCCTNLSPTFVWSEGLLWPCALVKTAPFLRTLSLKLLLVRNLDPALTDIKYFKELVEEAMAKKLEKADITYSHQNLKEVKLDSFTGCRTQVEFVLHLVDIAVSLEKITLHVSKRRPDVQIYKERGRFLKTKIRPEIDVCRKLMEGRRKLLEGHGKLLVGRMKLLECRKNLLDDRSGRKLLDDRRNLLEDRRKLLEGRRKLLEGHRKLLVGRRKLLEGHMELLEGRRKILEGCKKFFKGRSRKWLEGHRKLLKGHRKWLEDRRKSLDSRRKLLEGRKKFLKGRKKKLLEGRRKLLEGRRKLLDDRMKLLEGRRMLLEDHRKLLEWRRKLLQVHRKLLEAHKKLLKRRRMLLEESRKKLLKGRRKLFKGRGKLIEARKKLLKGRRMLLEGRRKLINGRRKLLEGRRTLLQGRRKLVVYRRNLLKGHRMLLDGHKKL
ncbi:hypothetical protein FNV43_RR20841 [Rhamnella rubrinervis]|uniref:F-box domain-containing protein n=1 Tax=Rhamnella rubrinervis TaxID=2594499 RepID=A0A8K0GXD0_9ROSA|nr:hypothetical protein FNV43_RR20841 [Rhamnella rubrinervis]